MQSETIYYNSPVGILEITAENDAIKKLHFLHTYKEDEKEMQELNFIPASQIARNCFQQLDRYFAGEVFSFDLGLSQSGTSFQEKVWKALCGIPFGRTMSYLELSKKLGDAKAIRAVGTANGKNNIAIIVPCHRVIGSNGSLVGYAGELWRKRWLINHEAKYANGVQMLF